MEYIILMSQKEDFQYLLESISIGNVCQNTD